MPLTPKEAAELALLESELSKLEAQASAKAAGAVLQAQAKTPINGLQQPQLSFNPIRLAGRSMWDLPRSENMQQTVAPVAETARSMVGMGADAGAEGSGATIGQAIGGPIGGSIGGMIGEGVGQYRRIRAGEQEKYSLGRTVGAGVVGAIPGASLAKGGVMPVLKEGGKAVAGNAIGKAAETRIDEGRSLTAAELGLAVGGAVIGTGGMRLMDRGGSTAASNAARVRNGPRDETLAMAAQHGLVHVPSDVRPGFVNNTLESLRGKEAIAQEATKANQALVTDLARADLKGFPTEAFLNKENLEAYRRTLSQPMAELESMAAKARNDLQLLEGRFVVSDPHQRAYLMSEPGTVRELADLGTKAAVSLEKLRLARAEEKSLFDAYRQGDLKALGPAREAGKRVDELHAEVEEGAKAFGRSDLSKAIKENRALMAKSWNVQNSLNPGDGSVSAPYLGNLLENDKAPLTGNLRIIARHENAFGRSTREASGTPNPNTSKLAASLIPIAAGSARNCQHRSETHLLLPV